MASISAWADANLAGGKRGQSSKVSGGQVRNFALTYAKLGAADGDGTILGIAEIPANAVLTSLLINNAALAGFTSISAGYYKKANDGTFLDTALSGGTSGKAVLMSAVDLNAGKANGSEQNGLVAVAIGDLSKKVWELLGYATPEASDGDYALCLTFTTAGTAAGNIVVRGSYILG